MVDTPQSLCSKPCDLCGLRATVRYRIQYTATPTWVLVCPTCQQQHSQNNPHYRYGGTWKARPKARPRVG
ncbi:MAG: hypothetical protein HC929_14955 [Leptolyngbyaceae cyanobacterium SM2_5_2]|nr:hypothetical protein [Leptolyngbyaceae cyanobacterium SM2_5_2]